MGPMDQCTKTNGGIVLHWPICPVQKKRTTQQANAQRLKEPHCRRHRSETLPPSMATLGVVLLLVLPGFQCPKRKSTCVRAVCSHVFVQSMCAVMPVCCVRPAKLSSVQVVKLCVHWVEYTCVCAPMSLCCMTYPASSGPCSRSAHSVTEYTGSERLRTGSRRKVIRTPTILTIMGHLGTDKQGRLSASKLRA